MVSGCIIRGQTFMTSTRRGGVRLRWTHVDGVSSMWTPTQKIRAHRLCHPVFFSCKGRIPDAHRLRRLLLSLYYREQQHYCTANTRKKKSENLKSSNATIEEEHIISMMPTYNLMIHKSNRFRNKTAAITQTCLQQIWTEVLQQKHFTDCNNSNNNNNNSLILKLTEHSMITNIV